MILKIHTESSIDTGYRKLYADNQKRVTSRVRYELLFEKVLDIFE